MDYPFSSPYGILWIWGELVSLAKILIWFFMHWLYTPFVHGLCLFSLRHFFIPFSSFCLSSKNNNNISKIIYIYIYIYIYI